MPEYKLNEYESHLLRALNNAKNRIAELNSRNLQLKSRVNELEYLIEKGQRSKAPALPGVA